MVEQATLERGWSGTDGPPVWETVMGDGVPLEHEIGVAGDHRFRYGSATFHVSTDGGTVLCAPEDPLDAAWQRQLLDTILFSVSFVNGYELLHASAVEWEGEVVAFVAGSGAGKSTLAAELVRRGRPLFCDDVLAIGHGPDGLLCFPGPAVMNLPDAAGAPDALGASVIATFPDEAERWVAMRETADAPRPLIAVYVLDRGAERPSVVDVPGASVVDLLPHGISLPHDLQRARERFGVFSALAEQVALRRLRSTPDCDPAALADLVETSIHRPASRRAAVPA
jgi:hypothetical protein